MFVCICRAVSSTDVRAAIAEGARTVKQVAEACGASRDCGKCVVHVRALLDVEHGPRGRGRLPQECESEAAAPTTTEGTSSDGLPGVHLPRTGLRPVADRVGPGNGEAAAARGHPPLGLPRLG
ncbi:(2Fe-2S)-binding protein [Geodermatophilus sabuli]|uniref:(2Fe-2S)-binding protein n=1 Tax=Geodermatophilus sabuli TaxID=1564158 RepID=UPI000BE3EAD4